MNGIPQQRGTLNTLTFHPDNFDVVRASAIEDITLAMRQDRPPRNLATDILTREQPQVAYRDARYIGLLAGMVEQFADRTEHIITSIAMDTPPDVAAPLIEERKTQGEVAENLAQLIRAEGDWAEIADADPMDADLWAEMLRMEGL